MERQHHVISPENLQGRVVINIQDAPPIPALGNHNLLFRQEEPIIPPTPPNSPEVGGLPRPPQRLRNEGLQRLVNSRMAPQIPALLDPAVVRRQPQPD